MDKPFMEDEIYPLTITSDRYSGTYSEGNYIAWHLTADEVPEAIYYDDYTCMEFWNNNKIICGRGRTVSEALADLYLKLKGGAE